ncbi:DNA polymerase III subunit alpha [Caldilinea sp.]|uniref:DNA polymerase III subunit alpha n=1 Tax=Caldilinea sp. TaxID=2293560 RepID=UPI0021DEF9BB|nr:DNA polymerase III subunit alpha [Caldilinea sp.]GIV69811.1 MAG: DNA-directed DNA polymerase [Caldilinea sp.]
MADDFVHLHVHSEYSLLDGLGRIKSLVKEAVKLGQPALALTDHGVMHGAIEFFRACREAGIRPIIGIEAYQTVWGRPMTGRDPQLDRDNYHLLLLAKNMTGYRNLLKIATRSQLDGYYYKPRIDHEFLAAHAEGLIASTGCLGAEVPQLLAQGKEREAYERLGWYVDVFGKENFFIELQEHSIPELVQVNKILVPWAEKFGLNLVVTNDVHYVREEDGGPHDVLLCVQTGATLDQPNRMRMSDGSYFLKSRAQMEATFRPFIDLPASAFDHTLRIAEMCEVDLEDPTYHLPDLPIPEGFTYETYLRHLTEEGLRRLYGDRADDPEVQERKERELRTIHEMGFDVYYLIVADLCNFARSRNIWWNVRGSGAGSLVAYCIGITSIDPLKNNLIFERFLNPGRVTMPDFDLDFPDDQREEMIRYTVQKYGESQVAQIATFNRMKAKAAVRDVGRAQGIELAKVDYIAKLIPGIPGKPVTIKDCLTEGHEFYNQELVDLYNKETWVRKLLDTAMQLEGVARNAGVHAAAVIVADKELTHYTPLMRGSKSTVTSTIAQYEFPILESIGLLKVDFLGLSTLSVMREAARLIKERHGVEYTLQTIPYEGEAAREAFKLLSSGEVSGVFQVESQGMRRVLTEMKPTTFEHIVAVISLYRPGPMEYIPSFIRRMHGQEPVEYKHPMLEKILAETYGIIVYQEQIIQILSHLAGYTPGEADLLRRAIGKKKASEIEKHKKIFIAGCEKNGIDPAIAAEIYADIEFFARYGFNKSHAADYAVITVQTAYLKAHYPVEYMAAQLLVERDKTEKVANFINECRRMGIDVLPPDVNYSGLDFEIQQRPADTPTLAHRDPNLGYPFPVPEGSAIRFGMAAIKNVGEGPVRVILEARQKGGPFKSLEDFCDRVDLRQVNKRALECLIKAGAFDRFGKRSQLLAVLDQMVSASAAVHDARESGQLSIFDMLGAAKEEAHVSPIKLPDIEEVKGREKLQWEKELLGVYSISHPLHQLKIDFKRITTCSCAELDERYDGKGVTLAGVITNVRVINTKKGDQMAFVQLEDLQGGCEVVFFPKAYAEFKEKLVVDSVVIVKGKAQTREGQTTLLADIVQTHVESYIGVEEETPALQTPLFQDAPPQNGAAPSTRGGNGFASDMEAWEEAEMSPFYNEPPQWTDDEEADAVALSPAAEPSAIPIHGEAKSPEDQHSFQNGAALHSAESAAPSKIGPEAEPVEPETSETAADKTQRSASESSPEASSVASGEETRRPSISKVVSHPRPMRRLLINFRRTGNLERDKYRLRELYETVREPKGRDAFVIRLLDNGRIVELSFPNDGCTITEKLKTELQKHFRVDYEIEELAEP